ncbi:site-2 protease family protein [Vallitalea pronyensis]|uniref:Site-2 protease family protein n=1 Tax=Vallitalea pronyensis TaxID=1348613 RepID=A0A8J8MKE1_9FIRM|nr:site-2 protease family protein [Vallitalea pronyensis]QUI23086.1 site-2 protease family protein [Vallitalea pronyensis]
MLNLLKSYGIFLIAAVVVVCIHEYPKIFVYKYLEHPIYKKQTKVSLNPKKYIDPFGLICFVFLRVGWQKPFQFNYGRLKDKNKGLLAISLTGILSNLLFLTVLMPVYTNVYYINPELSMFISALMEFNMVMVIVNLLPVPPFDMAKIIQAVNPQTYFRFIQYEKMIQAFFILALAIGFVRRFVVLTYNAFVPNILNMIG